MKKDFSTLSISFLQNVCFVTLNDPASKNAMSFEMAEELHELFTSQKLEKWLAEKNCGLIVIASSQRSIFASGGHLKQLAECTEAKAKKYINTMNVICARLRNINVPTVTLLEGAAFGGGSELALSTDFRWSVGLKSALHFWQTKWGVPGGWGGMQRWDHLSSMSPRSTGILLSAAESFNLCRLKELGIIDRSFISREACLLSLQDFAQRYLSCSPALREKLLNRNSTAKDDQKMFSSFWMKGEHKKKLAEYRKKKQK